VFFVYTMNDTQHRGQWDDSYGTQVTSDGSRAPGRGQYEEIKVEGHGDHGDALERGALHGHRFDTGPCSSGSKRRARRAEPKPTHVQ